MDDNSEYGPQLAGGVQHYNSGCNFVAPSASALESASMSNAATASSNGYAVHQTYADLACSPLSSAVYGSHRYHSAAAAAAAAAVAIGNSSSGGRLLTSPTTSSSCSAIYSSFHSNGLCSLGPSARTVSSAAAMGSSGGSGGSSGSPSNGSLFPSGSVPFQGTIAYMRCIDFHFESRC